MVPWNEHHVLDYHFEHIALTVAGSGKETNLRRQRVQSIGHLTCLLQEHNQQSAIIIIRTLLLFAPIFRAQLAGYRTES